MNTTCILAKVKVTSVKDTGKSLGDSVKDAFIPGPAKPASASEKTGEEVTMEPVTDDTPENKTFSDATPSGRIILTITNKDAFGFFVEGAEHNVKIYPA